MPKSEHIGCRHEHTSEMEQAVKALAAAIEYVTERGWNGHLREDEWCVHCSSVPGRVRLCYPMPSKGQVLHMDSFEIVFSHDFAEALWGDSFKVRLTEMVLADNPLRYLKNYMPEAARA